LPVPSWYSGHANSGTPPTWSRTSIRRNGSAAMPMSREVGDRGGDDEWVRVDSATASVRPPVPAMAPHLAAHAGGPRYLGLS